MMDIWAKALLALTIIMEARSQPDLGKAMVAQVAVNRSQSLTIDGVPSVELALFEGEGAAFAVWGLDVYGPGVALRLAVLECVGLGAFPDDPWCVEGWMDAHAPDWGLRLKIGSAEYWEGVWAIASDVYDGSWHPPPQLAGKRHFDNPRFWPEGLPPWMENCVEVGDHVFCD